MVNAGSSSLKLSVLEADDASLMTAELPMPESGAIGEVVAQALRDAPGVDAVGHRVVHGGLEFTTPVRVEAAFESRLERLAELAPLHNPAAIAAILSLRSLWPDLQFVMSNPKADTAPAKRKLLDIKLGKASGWVKDAVIDLIAKTAAEVIKG